MRISEFWRYIMKLTIIIPVYNKKRYLSGLLEQVMGQTFWDFECLLIDDGSTDGSGAICDEFANRDTRFRVFHIPNGGASHARNLGLDHARGEYVTFIDGDDKILPDYLSNLNRCAEEFDVPMVIGNIQKVWDNREDIVPLQIPYKGLYEFSDLLPDFARVQKETGIYGFCVAKLIHRDLIADTRFDPKIKLAEDLNFYLDLYAKIQSIYFDQKPNYSYLQAAENSSMLDADDKIDYFTQLVIQRKIVRFLMDKEAFTGENLRIMVDRLYDYVYFCLYHCRPAGLISVCSDIRALELPSRRRNAQDSVFKTLLLFLFMHKMDRTIWLVMFFYRGARSAAQKLRKRRGRT